MTINKYLFATLACLSVCTVQGASLPEARAVAPISLARITEANYCFARTRLFNPERQPPSYLVLRLRIQVAYRNTVTRPLIIPIEHERTVYTALKPGVMD